MAWDKYILIIVDHTKIDEDLVDFPLLINLSTDSGTNSFDCSNLFTDISDANKLNIKLEDASNNQKYVEIESWDSINKKAILHAKVDLSSTTDSIFRFYYDATQADNTTYVGVTGSAAALNVWDSNFKAVYTMAQNPGIGGACILDSTINAKHGTPYGSMTREDLVDGLVSKAIEFDGVDDYINLPVISLATYTFEVLTKNTDAGYSAEGYIVCNGHGIITTQSPTYWALLYNNDMPLKTYSTLLTQEYKYIATTNNGNIRNLFDDGLNSSQPDTNTNMGLTGVYRIGYGYAGRKPNAIMEHIRISDVARSNSWIKATNYSLRDELISLIGIRYKISGNTLINATPTETNIYLYDVSNGSLITSLTSDSAGYFEYLTLLSNTPIDVVAISPDSQYNDMIYRVTPVLVE